MNVKKNNLLLSLVYLLFIALFILCLVSVFFVTIFKVHLRSLISLKTYVKNVSTNYEQIYGERGLIYDSGGQVVAQNAKTYNIICYLNKNRGTKDNPEYVDDPLYTSQVLANILKGDQKEIYNYLTQNPNLYQTELGNIGRNLSKEIVKQIKSDKNLHGIGFKESFKRIYPLGSMFSPYFVGFAQADEDGKLIGKMGLEKYLDTKLAGKNGLHIYQADKDGYILPGMYDKVEPATNGHSVYLTFDASVQEALNEALQQVVTQNGASVAFGAVMEVKTGRLLAAGQTPSFDPNKLEIKDYKNYLTQYLYEPGSVMKSIIYSAAMDLGKYDGKRGFDSSPFCFYADGNNPFRTYGPEQYGCIYNAGHKNWGTIDLDHGLIYSSNVATSTLLTEYVGARKFEEYLKRFGFFSKVESDGLEENEGYKNYYYPSEKLSLSYGQGSSITAFQMLQAYSAIFGNGEMIKPYFIDKIVDASGNSVYQAQRQVVNRPISENVAKQMQALLARVVSDPAGTAQFYGIKEVDVAAKTGTSEIAINGKYESSEAIASVLMGFPADKPKIIIYFAYIAPYDYYMHLKSKPINDLTRRVVMLTKVNLKKEFREKHTKIISSKMLKVVGKDFNETSDLLQEKGLEVIKIGSGNLITKQWPLEDSVIHTGEKVFLRTEGDILIPNFKNWTRKEIMAYYQMSNLPITIKGYGIVVKQSLEVGSIFKGQNIILELDDIKKEKPIVKQQEENNTQEDSEEKQDELEEE